MSIRVNSSHIKVTKKKKKKKITKAQLPLPLGGPDKGPGT